VGYVYRIALSFPRIGKSERPNNLVASDVPSNKSGKTGAKNKRTAFQTAKEARQPLFFLEFIRKNS